LSLQVGELFAKLGLNDTEFTGKLNKAQSTLQSAGGAMSKPLGFLGNMLSTAGGFVAANVFSSLASQIGEVTGAMVGGNADFEMYQAQFATLMGNSDQAAAHLGNLAAFAAKTPFELPEVVVGSRNLLTFGGAALNTEANITMVGNAAAATSQKFDEVAFWVGRAYGSIQAGKPFGEAAMRLQEMGILTGSARDKLEGLQEAGKSGPAVWAAFQSSITAPKDAMDKLGATFVGLKSTAVDNLGALGREAGAPLFAFAKQMLQAFNTDAVQNQLRAFASQTASILGSVISWVTGTAVPAFTRAWQMVTPALSAVGGAVSALMGLLQALGVSAGGYGANIGVQFANGILQSITYVANAVTALARVVTYWLQPHSPPKALPELDQWGTAAGEIWGEGWASADITNSLQALTGQIKPALDAAANDAIATAADAGQSMVDSLMSGWSEGDFSVFNELSGAMKSSLDSLVDVGQLDKEGVIPRLMGGRDAIARAINEVDELGAVSSKTLQEIADLGGSAGGQLADLVQSYSDLRGATEEVAAAQEELNRVTEEYDSKLAPLNAALKETQDKEDAIKDQQRLKKLQEESVDASKTAEERELAKLEMLEIGQRQQIKAVENEKDARVDTAQAAVEAAEKKQKAAQAEFNSQKALIEANNEQNRLIAEQVKLLQQLAKEKESAGKKGGGAGAPALPPMPEMPPLPGAPKPISGADAARNRFNDMKANQADQADKGGSGDANAGQVSGMMGGLLELGGMAESLGGLPTILGGIAGALGGVALISAGAIPWIAALFSGFAGLETVGGVIAMLMWGIAGAWTGLTTGAMLLINPLTLIPTVLSAMGAAFSALMSPASCLIAVAATFGAAWANNVGGLRDITMQTFSLIGSIVGAVLGQIMGFISTYGPQISASFGAAFMAAQQVVAGVFGAIFSVINTVLTAILGFITTNGPAIQAQFATAFTAIASIVQSVMGILQATIIPVLSAIASFIGAHTSEIQGIFGAAWNMISAIVTTVLGVIAGVLRAALAAIHGDWAGAWAGISDALTAVLNGIKTFFSGWLQGITSMLKLALNGEIVDTAVKLGGNIIDGIVKGIKSGASALLAAAKEAAAGALQAAKDFLGIKSPSREAADQVGEPFTQGIGAGILAGVEGLKKIVKKVSKDMLKETAELAKQVAEIMAGSMRDGLSGAAQNARQDLKNLDSLNALKGKQEEAPTGMNPAETAALQAEYAAKNQKYTNLATQAQDELNQAQAEATEIAKYDAEYAASYYKERSDQIFELANLNKAMLDAGTDAEKQAIAQKIELTKKAQAAELALKRDQAKDSSGEFDSVREQLTERLKQANAEKRNHQILLDAYTKQKNAGGIATYTQKVADDQKVVDQLQAAMNGIGTGVGSMFEQVSGIIGPQIERTLSPAIANAMAQAWSANPAQLIKKEYVLNVTTQATTAAVIKEFGVLESMSGA
jgi:phage-related protein